MRAILVGVQLPATDTDALNESLHELRRLVETLGFTVIGSVTQKRKAPSPATIVGEGKLKEIARWTGGSGKVIRHGQSAGTSEGVDTDLAEDSGDESTHDSVEAERLESSAPLPDKLATHIIFDHELTPNQLKNIQEATGAEILDRTGVIVEIFHRHAKTREAQLQVEIARLKYLSPRIRVTGPSDRQGGGVGSKGIGETSHELDKRRIRDRVAELQRELDAIQGDRDVRRSRRKDQWRVALIGYTNAGKSSLMRALTGSEVLVADKLFATLDTTIRSMQPDTFPRVLISDTVGFIKKLPHDLVASFRSTLDEAAEASLLLYVVDASDPSFRSQLEVTKNVLSEIDAADVESRLILNKVDCLDVVQVHLLKNEFPDAILISTRNPEDIQAVKRLIREFLERDLKDAEVLIPFDDKAGVLGEIRKNAAVLSETFEADGVRMKVRTTPEYLVKLQKLVVSG